MTVGVLGLQGSVKEHCDSVNEFGDQSVVVRYPEDLENIDALIIPGGESTTLLKLLKIKDMDRAIKKKALSGLPIWGTCAGLILLSRKVDDNSVEPLNLIDIITKRNGYGNQHDSFTADLTVKGEIANVRFIRAPKILECGPGVKELAHYNNSCVAASFKKILVTTFHPEVTGDKYFYKYFRSFIEM